MSRPPAAALAVGALAALILAGAGLLAPIEVRHSAPFGFSLTFDARRGIAVSGGFVRPNYPNFDRVDLDLRAYAVEANYDLTLHVRPDRPGAADVRTIPFSVPGAEIRHDKPAFSNPFVTLRFPPIERSTGRRYYVWVERGPRNRDDVVALWSIKSYSHATGRDVLAAFLQDAPGQGRPAWARSGLVALLVTSVVVFGWLIAAVTAVAVRTARTAPRPGASVPTGRSGWYTLQPPTRRPRRRVVAFWERRSRSPARAPRGPFDTRQARQERD